MVGKLNFLWGRLHTDFGEGEELEAGVAAVPEVQPPPVRNTLSSQRAQRPPASCHLNPAAQAADFHEKRSPDLQQSERRERLANERGCLHVHAHSYCRSEDSLERNGNKPYHQSTGVPEVHKSQMIFPWA